MNCWSRSYGTVAKFTIFFKHGGHASREISRKRKLGHELEVSMSTTLLQISILLRSWSVCYSLSMFFILSGLNNGVARM